MPKIAIVEDNRSAAEKLKGYLERFSKQENLVVYIDVFNEALSFLEHYKPVYDIVSIQPDLEGGIVNG